MPIWRKMNLLNTSNGNLHPKTLQPYYTKSSPIVETMLCNLSPEKGDRVLEPCGGDGVFVNALLKWSDELTIDVYELDEHAVETLHHQFEKLTHVNIFHKDFLIDTELQLLALSGGQYDRIIANPPYGAWQNFDKRKLLKKMFPDLYVKESYALFLYRCIQLLKVGGRLTFIIPDSFLNLHRHTQLRYMLFNCCKIERIQLFPSHFFPDVRFGYTGLCIITLEKSPSPAVSKENSFLVETNYATVDALRHSEQIKTYHFNQQQVLQQKSSALFISENPLVTDLLNNATYTIGDVAHCATGFYSGDDQQFLRSASHLNKNRKKYHMFDPESRFMGSDIPLNGIDDKQCFIPIVKGGNIRYYKHDRWYVDWGVDAVQHYQQGKKGRFQNAQFYFREGIAVPMVSAKTITASILDGRLFDQSIVGVFPHHSIYKHYLLAFFNSPTANCLIRTINRTANNSANYLKKIPFIIPPPQLLVQINEITKSLINDAKNGMSINKNLSCRSDEIIREIYRF